MTFSTLAGKQYTIDIAGDETLDHLARTIKATLDQDKESNIHQSPYLHITYGSNRIISPLQVASAVNKIFN